MDNKNEQKSHEKLMSILGHCQGNYIPSFAFRMTYLTPKQKALLFRMPRLSDNDYLACFYSSKSIATLVFDDTLSANAVDQIITEVKHSGYLDVLEIEVYGRINRGLRVSEKFCNECNKLNKDNQKRTAKFKRSSENDRSTCRNQKVNLSKTTGRSVETTSKKQEETQAKPNLASSVDKKILEKNKSDETKMHISEYVNPSKNNPSDLSDFCLSKKITEKADNETNRLIARLRLEALMHKSQAVKFVNLFGYENAYERLERAKFHYPSDESRVGRVLGGQMKKALKTKPEMMQKQDHVVIEENPDQEKNKHHDAINHVWNQLAPKAHRSEKIDVELAKSVMETIEAYSEADQHQRLDAKLHGKETTILELYFAMKEVIEAENEDIDPTDEQSHTDNLTRLKSGHDADKDDGENRSAESIPPTPSMSSSTSESPTKPVTEKSTALLVLKDKLLATVMEKLESRRANENFGSVKSSNSLNNKQFGSVKPEFGSVNGSVKSEIGSVNGSVKSEIGSVNGSVKSEIGSVNCEHRIDELLQSVKKYPGKNAKFHGKKINMSERSAYRKLATLKKEGKISYKGSAKTGGYYVVPA